MTDALELRQQRAVPRADDNTIMLALFESVKGVKIPVGGPFDRNKLTYSEPSYINFGASGGRCRRRGMAGSRGVVQPPGHEAERPTAAGLYIKRLTMSDGSVKTTKSVVR